AITIGARQDITREQWDRYARTGTSHLMAISGLHVGLAAAGLFFLVRVVATPFARGRNVRDIAILAATAGACGYALVSGLAIPAQRASLMVLLVAVAALLRRRQDPIRVLSIVVTLILVTDPLASLTPGFQLSFLAVLLLLLAAQQTAPANRTAGPGATSRLSDPVARLLVLQCVLLLGLLPVTVLQFGRIAWLAPMTNLLVLPVFNLCTVPLALLALLLDGPLQTVGNVLLQWSWHSVRAVLAVVDFASGLQGADHRTLPVRGAMLVVLWITALWALLPPGFPGRNAAWVAASALVLQKPDLPPADCVDVQVLDVGQGLSVVIQTRAHLAVFDTGPAFRSGGNTASLVLLPFLRSRGVARIDKLIVSHADLDHAGGLDEVLANVEVAELLAGEPLAADDLPPVAAKPCIDGMRWHWDGIDFRVIHPEPDRPRTGNNASCVLQLDAGGNRMLIAGDIERPAEQALVSRRKLKPSQLVVVPHHGSRTSSSRPFVESLRAEFAI
ncbi:MAG: DNA internalization-related competence protein ComEC/Rec2, partial [Woeseiaceae bacterium]